MSKVETFINLLQEVISEIDKENADVNSIWDKSFLDKWVKPEVAELLQYAKKGEVYFKYGKKQRMLHTTRYMADTFAPLGKTQLGKIILELQELYNKL